MARWKNLPTNLKIGKKTASIRSSQLPPPYERQLQISLIEWSENIRYKNQPLSLYIHHSPNGGKRDSREANYFKAMGTRAGYPDLTVDIAKGGYHGMRMELKRTAKETTSPNQDESLARLREEGYYAIVCSSFEEAIKEIHCYIKGLTINPNKDN